jgi:hypothetical protein
MPGTFFIYNLILLISVFFAWISENTKHYEKLFITFSFFTILIISCLRFDIGYDYDHYAHTFKEVYYNTIYNTDILNRISLYYWICRLFSFSSKGYIFVIGIYSFFTLYFLFNALTYRKILSGGIFIFVTYNMLFVSFDQIRQTLAIVIFIYSIKYVEQKKLKSYLFYMLLACTVHLSAIAVLPFYFINKLEKPKLRIWAVIIPIFIFGYYSGLWEAIREAFFKIIPYYNFYAQYQNQLNSAKLNSNIGVAYLVVVSLLLLWLLKKHNKPIFFYTTAFGLIFYLFASNNLNLWRFANYFLFYQAISIPVVIQQNKNIFSLIRIFFVFTALIIFQMNIMNSPRGTSPYQSILSKNFKKEIFKHD